MRLEQGDKSYPLPSEWSEVTLQQILDSRELADQMPERYYESIFKNEKGKEFEFTDNEKIDIWAFKRKWVGFWTGISEDDNSIHVNDLEDCYSILAMFLGSPKSSDLPIIESIDFKGISYYLPKTEKIAGGSVKHMADCSYQEFIEGAQLTNRLNRISEGDLTVLALLTATYYRPKVTTGMLWWKKTEVEEYDEAKVLARAEVFKELPMDKVWSSYFFLDKHLHTYLNGLQTSFQEEVDQTNTDGTT